MTIKNNKKVYAKTTKRFSLFPLVFVILFASGVQAIPKTLSTAGNPSPVACLMSQNGNKIGGSIFLNIDRLPRFPGGEEGMFSYIKDNLAYPEAAQHKGIQGRVTIKFMVRKDGRISDVALLKGISKTCDTEALRVVKSMPNWNPCVKNGQRVDMHYTLPIVFKLRE